MSEEELVEALAKRLFHIADFTVEAGPLWWGEATERGKEDWRELARECLRQMEWAWEKGWKDHERLGETDTEANGRFQGIAPEGWRK